MSKETRSQKTTTSKLALPDTPGLRRDLLAVALLAATGSLVMGAQGPILPMYLDNIGIDVQSIGLLYSVSAIAVAAGEFSWGWALDRVHFKLPMSVGTVGLAFVIFSFALTQSLPILFLLFFLRGTTASATYPVGRAFVGSTMAAHQKALFLGLFSTILGAGRTLGAFGSGYVAEGLGYGAVFVICAALAVVGGIIGLPILRARRLTQYADRSVPQNKEEINAARSGSSELASFKTQGLIAILTFVPMGVTGTFIPLLAKKVILLQPADVGLAYSITGFVSMLLAIPMGRLSDRYGRRLFMAGGLTITCISLICMAFANSFPTLLLFMVFNTVGMAAFGPAAVALLSDSAPIDKQGTAMGLYGLCEDIGIIMGPAIGGLLWESFGPQPTFWFGAAPVLVAAIVVTATVRRRRALQQSNA